MLNIEKFNYNLYMFLLIFSVFGFSTLGINIGINFTFYRLAIVIFTVSFLLFSPKITFSKQLKPIIVFYVFWIGYALLSILWCVDIALWFNHMRYLCYGVLILFATLSVLNDNRKVFNAIGIWVYVSIAVVLASFIEIFTGNYLFVNDFTIPSIQVHIDNNIPLVTFGNCNNLSVFLMMSIFMTLCVCKCQNSNYCKCFLRALLLFQFTIITISNSRANILGCLLGVIVWLMITYNIKMNLKYILPFVLIFGVVALINYDALIFYEMSNSDNLRVNMIRSGFDMLINSYGFGVGAGNSNVLSYYTYYVSEIHNLHNWWIQVLAEFGIFTAVCYYLVFYYMIKKLFYIAKYESDFITRNLAKCFCCIQVASIISFISPSSIFGLTWIWMFWGVELTFLNQYYVSAVTVMKER